MSQKYFWVDKMPREISIKLHIQYNRSDHDIVHVKKTPLANWQMIGSVAARLFVITQNVFSKYLNKYY